MHLDLVLSALANPTRRAILDRLMAGEATPGDLAQPFALSQPTISTHLKVLEEAGLITRSRRANQRPVRLAPASLMQLDDWISRYRRLWEGQMDRLEDYARSLQDKDTADDDRNA